MPSPSVPDPVQAPDGAIAVSYSDGRRAAAVAATAGVDGTVLRIRGADGVQLDAWPLSSIRMVSAPGHKTPGLFQGGADGHARLRIAGTELVARLRAAGATLGPPDYVDPRRARRVVTIALPVAVALAALVAAAVPMAGAWIAATIPSRAVVALGDRQAEDLAKLLASPGRQPVCTQAQGMRALDALVSRLQAAARLDPPPRVRVVDGPIENAFALPGGRILIMRGLIEAAETPDEVAGVLAHEFAHVAAGHAIAVAVQGAVAGALAMVAMSQRALIPWSHGVVARLAAAPYGRAAEEQADAGARAMLGEAGIGADGFARFLERAAERSGGAAGILSTHPPPAQRARQASAVVGASLAPAMSPADWAALRGICGAR
jgi:Zn-dependent protease with chaperone function